MVFAKVSQDAVIEYIVPVLFQTQRTSLSEPHVDKSCHFPKDNRKIRLKMLCFEDFRLPGTRKPDRFCPAEYQRNIAGTAFYAIQLQLVRSLFVCNLNCLFRSKESIRDFFGPAPTTALISLDNFSLSSVEFDRLRWLY